MIAIALTACGSPTEPVDADGDGCSDQLAASVGRAEVTQTIVVEPACDDPPASRSWRGLEPSGVSSFGGGECAYTFHESAGGVDYEEVVYARSGGEHVTDWTHSVFLGGAEDLEADCSWRLEPAD